MTGLLRRLDAAADTIQIEDITSDPINQKILRRLRENDADFDELWVTKKSRWSEDNIYCPQSAEELGWLGYFVSNNTHLRKLEVCSFWIVEVEQFCCGVNFNKSIEKIGINGDDDSGLFELFIPFINQNKNLHHFGIRNESLSHSIKLGRLTLAIKGSGSLLKHVELYWCQKFEYNGEIGIYGVDRILESLKSHPVLEELELSSMYIGVEECSSLSSFLRTSAPVLHRLNLRDNFLNGECLVALVEALHHRNSLKFLDLSYNFDGTDSPSAVAILTHGWRSLARLISNQDCNLEELILDHCEIGDMIADFLINAMITNTKLTRLALSRGNRIINSWNAFARMLCDRHQLEEVWLVNIIDRENCGQSWAVSSLFLPSTGTGELFKFSLSSHPWRCDEGVDTILGNINNDNIHDLDLSNNRQITAQGWRSLPLSLKNTCPSLERLYLNRCNIDDDGLNVLVNVLQHSMLKILDLSYNDDVTTRGWQCTSSLIESPNIELEELHLNHNSSISDNEASMYAQSLSGNDKLHTLSLVGTSITISGWDRLYHVICDTSSINNTFLSNHSLCNLGEEMALHYMRVLELNNRSNCVCFFDLDDDEKEELDEPICYECDKAAVAVIKILNHHHHFDMTPLFEWDHKTLPIIVRWSERARLIDMQVKNDDYDLWFDNSDLYLPIDNDDGYFDEYLLPLWQQYHTRLDQVMLDAIYQFIRAMPEIFESVQAAGSSEE